MTAWRIIVRENRGRRLFFGQKKILRQEAKKLSVRSKQQWMTKLNINCVIFFIFNLIEEQNIGLFKGETGYFRCFCWQHWLVLGCWFAFHGRRNNPTQSRIKRRRKIYSSIVSPSSPNALMHRDLIGHALSIPTFTHCEKERRDVTSHSFPFSFLFLQSIDLIPIFGGKVPL